jgi:hypothetical protein
MSVTCNGIIYQLVVYYGIADAISRKMSVLLEDLMFTHTHPRPALLYSQKPCNLFKDRRSINRSIYFDNRSEMTMPSTAYEHITMATVPEIFPSSGETLASMYDPKYAMYFPPKLDENSLRVNTSTLRYPSKYPPPT